jgi:iron complex outermembrane receptor protein
MNGTSETNFGGYMASAALALMLCTVASPTLAQDGRSIALEEIIVTAQKREQSLQSVPISITALSGEDMREADIFSLDGIAERTPGFSMGSFNKGQPQLYIRGIGSNDDGAGADVSVVTFIDEVYIGRAAGQVFELFDLERVEVLRGPQGTLFGKNAIGGAVSLHTSKPDENFMGRAEVSAGNLNSLVLRGLVSGPISDNVFGKIAVNSRKRDGYVESLVTGDKLADQDTLNTRGALRFVPSDELEIMLTADYGQSRENGQGRIIVGPGLLFASAVASNPEAVGNNRKSFADEPGKADTDIWGISARVNWDVGNGTLSSITAYRESKYDMLDDTTGNNVVTAGPLDSHTWIDESAEQISQEIRYSSTALDDRLSWVAGLYYLVEDVYREESSAIGFGFAPTFGTATSRSFMDNKTDSTSVFADFTYNFTDAFSLTAGGRYTDEKKNSHIIGVAPTVVPHTIAEDYNVRSSKSWTAFTPRIVLNYQVNESVFMYASISEGFKSGGYPGTPANAEAAGSPFDQEDATAYELGIKSELFDNRLRLNVAAFSTDYQDLQVLLRKIRFPGDLGIVVTDNAADATSKGIEVEFTALLTENFEISGNYAYLDAKYDNYLEPNGTDNAGNRLRNAPENAVNLVARYSRTLGNGAELGIRYEYINQGKTYQDPRNEEGAAKPKYTVSNLRASYAPSEANWELSVWAQNLFDEEYFTHAWPAQPFASGFGAAAPPRTYGVTALVNFGGR